MHRALAGLATLLGLLGGLATAEAPRLRWLTGADARQADQWARQIEQLLDRDQLDEALKLAEKLHRLRQDRQGAGHWQTWNEQTHVAELKRLRQRPARERLELRQVQRLHATSAQRSEEGRHAAAEQLLRQALAICRKALPSEHPLLASSLHKLAGNLHAQGRYAEAETLFRQALTLLQKAHPANHPVLASGLSTLANNLDVQGKYREAETRFRQALAIFQKALPADHPNLAIILNNLAHSLRTHGKYTEAETRYRQALAIFQKALPAGHPTLASSLHNLARLLRAQGKYAEAEQQFRQALAIRQKALPAGHPLLAFSLNNLGHTLSDQGKFAEAEPLHRQALAIRQKALPAGHRDLATSLVYLGLTLNAQGKYTEAERLYRQALAISHQALPAGHPDLANDLSNLAGTLELQGKYAEAEQMERQALAIRQNVLSAEHPQLATSLTNLAGILNAQSKYAEARKLLRKALTIQQKALPADHPDLVNSLHCLATNLGAQGQYPEAEHLDRQALAICRKALPPGHPQLATALNNLAVNLDAQGRYAEAEKLLRQALAIQQKVPPAGHLSLADSLGNLAFNLHAQGKDAEALELWQQASRSFEVARLLAAPSGNDRAVFAAGRFLPDLGRAAMLARLGHPRQGWHAAEALLARGLLDDLSAPTQADLSASQQRHLQAGKAELLMLSNQILRAHLQPRREEPQRKEMERWLTRSRQLGDQLAALAAAQSRRQVASLIEVQRTLPADAALVFWIDFSLHGKPEGEHWGCVVRARGKPAWVRLVGSGPNRSWIRADDTLPYHLRQALSRPAGTVWRDLARQLHALRLGPLEPHLQGVRHLIVVPAWSMAGVPLEVLSDRYQVSYTPSGTVHARLRRIHRPLQASLLALGDPVFHRAPPPEPPDHGLYLQQVLPNSNAARAGLKAGDVLLRYHGIKLQSLQDLKAVTQGTTPLPIQIWREGQVQDRTIAPGPLGVAIARDPAAVAVRKRRQAEALLVQRGGTYDPLPGTRLEVESLAQLFPKKRLLLGSQASEQRLDELIASGDLSHYRILHLATHGEMHPSRPSLCALILAQDQLPDPARQLEQGKKVYDGRLKVAALQQWPLDADLVVLSACETGLGPRGGGDGYLGFSQVLFKQGARSLVLSLWKVDDVATALLMRRFYQNLLGQRQGLKEKLGRAKALAEAKTWLRQLTRQEAERLAVRFSGGAWRGRVEKMRLTPDKKGEKPPAPQPTDRPFAHPAFWSAFILLGDPE
jgi:tetratricopeptide (TPR) repeat protein